ncbi:MAG: helix-turn-helix domain-containing protein [Eubacterium sp.]
MSFTKCNLTFGERLKELKDKTPDLTWKKVSDITGISVSTIYSYIDKKNLKSPNLDNAIELAKFFKVPLSYLCGEVDENNINDVNIVEAFFKILNVCNPDIGTDSQYPTLVFNKYNDDNNADLIKQFLVEYKYFEKMHSDGIIPKKLLNDYKEDLKKRYAFIPAMPSYEERIKIDKEVKEKRVELIDKEYS